MKSLMFVFFAFVLMNVMYGQERLYFIPGAWSAKYYMQDGYIKKSEVSNLMKNDAIALNHWKKYQGLEMTSYLFLAAEIGSGIWWINDIANKKSANLSSGLFVASAVGGLIMSFSAVEQRKKALLQFNGINGNKRKLSLQFGNDGVGFSMSLN